MFFNLWTFEQLLNFWLLFWKPHPTNLTLRLLAAKLCTNTQSLSALCPCEPCRNILHACCIHLELVNQCVKWRANNMLNENIPQPKLFCLKTNSMAQKWYKCLRIFVLSWLFVFFWHSSFIELHPLTNCLILVKATTPPTKHHTVVLVMFKPHAFLLRPSCVPIPSRC